MIDILGAVAGLGITAVVAIPVAIALVLDNPGPIFYSQTRCGLNGRPFRIWKFRSMVVGAEQLKHRVNNEASGHIFKNQNDPRITRVGRFLRRTSLDELPQFWNVLLGEMSLVGTRPPTKDEVMHYSSHHWERLNVKPGITGEWQTNGRSSIKDFEDIVRLDLDYQRKWSISYDISLLLKTLSVLINKSGAC
jgi:lipopolysaccharide/colanic/teichoic acid biosynthesis glycosyltransferase